MIIERNDWTTCTSQQSYLYQLPPSDPTYSTLQSDLSHPTTRDELSSHRTVSGRPSWIATAPSPSSTFSASVSLQGNVKPIFLIEKEKDHKLLSISYVPFDFSSLHIRIYTDAAFQNLKDKRSQIGFMLFLSDRSQ